MFGTTLEAELERVEGKNSKEIERKRRRILDKWIPEAPSPKSKSKGAPAPKFKDPMERFSK